MPDITRHIGRQMKGDKWSYGDKMNWRGSAGHLLRKNWEPQPSTVWGKSALQNKSALLWRCLTKVAQKSVLHAAKKSEECVLNQVPARASMSVPQESGRAQRVSDKSAQKELFYPRWGTKAKPPTDGFGLYSKNVTHGF